MRFSYQQDQLTVLGGLHAAFGAFGGVPRTVLFDRMKTAVAGADATGAAVFNAELLRFAAHSGFTPRACRPYRAKTKGRVERAVGYLRTSFFYGCTFRDLADLNARCAEWLAETANTRVHGTTGAIPAVQLLAERAALGPLPLAAYIPLITVGRRISRDGFVAYNGNAYSVPEGLRSAVVEVRATFDELQIRQDGKLVAHHRLLSGRGGQQLDPAHRCTRSVQAVLTDRKPASPPLPTIAVEERPLAVYAQVLR